MTVVCGRRRIVVDFMLGFEEGCVGVSDDVDADRGSGE